MVISRTNSAFNSKDKSKKHDLSKWTYAELRDAINTSCGQISFHWSLNIIILIIKLALLYRCYQWFFNIYTDDQGIVQ